MFSQNRLGKGHLKGTGSSGSRLLPFIVVSLLIAVAAGLVMPRKNREPTAMETASNQELIALISPFIPGQEAKAKSLSPGELALAKFGRQLFFDSKFSANGQVSCATCHHPERSFSDGLRFSHGLGVTSRNAPTLINSSAGIWFFWDGRSDSLAAQALHPIEAPGEHGINRTMVADIINREYRLEYEANFGPWPTALKETFPANAMPQPMRRLTPLAISAYAVQTLGNFDVLEKVLDRAEELEHAPAEELARQSAATPEIAAEWIKNWNAMPVDQQQAINQVFANFGRAIESYENGLVAINSAFDQFAQKIVAKEPLEQSFNQHFGQEELAGFRLFTGRARCTNCHIGPMFTDHQFHNTGFKGRSGPGEVEIDFGRAQGILEAIDSEFNCLGPFLNGKAQPGRENRESCLELPYLAINNIEFLGAFKTPTLRNIAETAPYGHDGRFADLKEILAHYNKLGQRPAVGHQAESLSPLYLNETELAQLEKFLISLSSPVTDLTLGGDIEQVR